jgi:hypothetical protein
MKELKQHQMEKQNQSQVIDAEAFTKEGKNLPAKGTFKIKVNEVSLFFEHPAVTGKQILLKAGFTPVECYILYQKLKGCEFEKIGLDELVNLARPGIERFVTKEPEVFHYTVDDEPEASEKKLMTAREILNAAGLGPNDYYLVEVFPDQQQKSYRDLADQPIELRCPGSKFISVFKGETPVS